MIQTNPHTWVYMAPPYLVSAHRQLDSGSFYLNLHRDGTAGHQHARLTSKILDPATTPTEIHQEAEKLLDWAHRHSAILEELIA